MMKPRMPCAIARHQQRVGHDRLAAAAAADDQRQVGLKLRVVGVEALERAAGVAEADDQALRAAAGRGHQR